MYYYISGALDSVVGDIAVVDCGGVGYKLHVSATAAGQLLPKLGERVKLYTYLKVQEDAMELYGFIGVDEKGAFEQLLSVSGVGAKAAMAVLSAMSYDLFALAVVSGDAKGISRAPGVGLKTAQRIILELKDKLAKEVGSAAKTSAQAGALPAQPGQSGKYGDAVDALLVLGYGRAEAQQALDGADMSQPLEALIRGALRQLDRR